MSKLTNMEHLRRIHSAARDLLAVSDLTDIRIAAGVVRNAQRVLKAFLDDYEIYEDTRRKLLDPGAET